MYEQFFNLIIKPFDLLPNPYFLFLSRSHKKAMTYLEYALRERAGFILLTGEIGSGKTTLIRSLINKHHKSIVLAKVSNTRVNVEQLFSLINDDFGIPVNSTEKTALLRDLNDFLIDQYANGNKPVLIIDEAQNLPPEILEDVRMLSNLETDNAKLLQIILVGQPELRETLAMPELIQLRQRISFYCHIRPLTRDEVEQYILHRLEIAGNRNAVNFLEGTLDLIWKYSRGIPRLINIICDFLLLSAFAEEEREISAELTREVIGELDFETQFWTSGTSQIAIDQGTISTNGKKTASDNVTTPLLHEILQRLDRIEKDSMELKNTVSTVLDEKLVSLSNTIRKQAEDNATSILTMNRKIESTAKDKGHFESPGEEERVGKNGFLRKIFK